MAITDKRGMFFRAFCQDELSQIVGGRQIKQINISRTSSEGTIRGMHLQYGSAAEMKFIRCIRGEVWDVVVDLRRESETYLLWYGVRLSEEDRRMIVIPERCAHGFQALQKGTELLYLHTASYAPELEGGVRYDDPLLEINWPLMPTEISERDLSYPLLQID